MSETPTKFPTISRGEILRRARLYLGRGQYKLGSGGFDPNAETPWHSVGEFLDCTGFAAWCIAEDRENHAIDGGWIETSAIVADALGPQRMFEHVDAPKPGDLIVFGDTRARTSPTSAGFTQGHVGILATCNAAGAPYTAVHCSHGNFKQFDHAIAETSVGIFMRNKAIFVRPRKIVEGEGA